MTNSVFARQSNTTAGRSVLDGRPAWRPEAFGEISQSETESFWDAPRHAAALSLLAATALKARAPQTAYMLADRRCRLPAPTAYDFLLRASASRLMNEAASAEDDLGKAFDIDPTHDLVIANVLRWGHPALRSLAAQSFLEDSSDDPEVFRLAMQAVDPEETPIVARLRVRDGMREGLVAWHGIGPLELTIRRGGSNKSFVLEPDSAETPGPPGWSAASIAIEIESPRLEAVTFRFRDKEAQIRFPAADLCSTRPPAGGARIVAGSQAVEVVVPVFGDYAATKTCLDALRREGSRLLVHITVIDDCSPDPAIRTLLDEGVARGHFKLIRNEHNLGFARSVNRALNEIARCDVLLLNADAILPHGAIDRLARAASSAPDIGTVTPFSNNGEFTSFPAPSIANDLPTPEVIAAIDGIAARVNGSAVVDLPNGVGFCLFITRACLGAVGGLPEIYDRGYYEDVDFCLRARELGFRSVCATGVFVGHAGARSFQTAKRPLVVRNLALLTERFPDHERECALFLDADTLQAARAKIEEQLPAQGPLVVLLSPHDPAHALALERGRQIESGGLLHCLHCEVDDKGANVTIRSLLRLAPQSLSFSLEDPSGLAQFRSYLTKLQLEAIEVLAPHALPDSVLRIAFELPAPTRVVFGDLIWMSDREFVFGRSPEQSIAEPRRLGCAGEADGRLARSARRARKSRDRNRVAIANAGAILPMDRMAAALCAVHLPSLRQAPMAKEKPIWKSAVRRGTATPKLAILCPEATADTDEQALAIGRLFFERRSALEAVVLGQCVDELDIMRRGRVFVTGVIAEEEYDRVLRQNDVTHLFSPYRTRHFGIVDRLSRTFGLSKVYFDWSFGALAVEAGDLALDPRICFESAAREILAWATEKRS